MVDVSLRIIFDRLTELGLRAHVRFDPDSDHDRTACNMSRRANFGLRRSLQPLIDFLAQ